MTSATLLMLVVVYAFIGVGATGVRAINGVKLESGVLIAFDIVFVSG